MTPPAQAKIGYNNPTPWKAYSRAEQDPFDRSHTARLLDCNGLSLPEFPPVWDRPKGFCMNYQKYYDLLIERARNRVVDGYVERHHILPECMGGGNEKSNLVLLTGREHYIAHVLLAKATRHAKHWATVKFMKTWSKSSKLHGVAAKLHAESIMGDNNPMRNKEVAKKSTLGLKKHYALNPDAQSGFNNGMFGKTHSKETKEFIANCRKGSKHSVETLEKFKSRKYHVWSPAEIELMKQRRKLQIGEKGPTYGKVRMNRDGVNAYIDKGLIDVKSQEGWVIGWK